MKAHLILILHATISSASVASVNGKTTDGIGKLQRLVVVNFLSTERSKPGSGGGRRKPTRESRVIPGTVEQPLLCVLCGVKGISGLQSLDSVARTD
jgi:hypothetical protein